MFRSDEFARKEVKVALAGEDELFGGYRRHVADQFAQQYENSPDSLRDGWRR